MHYLCIKKTEQTHQKKNIMATINLTKCGFSRRVASIKNIAEEWNFKGKRPAIIDFYASWCGPCKSLAPTLEELSEEYEGKVDIYKVDVDSEPELAAAFGVRSIPTLVFVPLTGAPQTRVGALPKAALREAIDTLIG
jgi:thioredoxin